MTTRSRLGWWIALASLAVACSAAEKTTLTGSSGVGASGSVGGDANVGGSFSGAGGSACETFCSGDLKKVIDCNNNVVKACSGDEGCYDSDCIPDPCGAAEQAKSSYGCDYWAVKPDVISELRGACFAAFVANTWSVPVHIDVLRNGAKFVDTSFIVIPKGQGSKLFYQFYNAKNGLPPGEVAILFLAHESPSPSGLPPCPVTPAVNGEVGLNGTGIGSAFEIRTDRPVVAYSILPYGGGPSAATSASLLLPTSAWDTNYVAVNAYRQSVVAAGAGAVPSLDILAREDGTEVTILPKMAIVPKGQVQGASKNTPVTYSLKAGEYLQISQAAELTGSPIQSNKPVGLWGGASCLNVLPQDVACDSAHQQIPPVRALGSEYALVRYRNRKAAQSEESPPWRIVGAVDGTLLTWEPEKPPGAPAALNLGQVFEFKGTGPWVVKSQDAQHPFYVAQYMTGAGHISPFEGEGDPEWVNVVPSAQYLEDYVFFTDPTYPETNLVVVRKKSPVTKQFEDVEIDCAGKLIAWLPIGASDYEYTRFDLVSGDFQNFGNCSNGRQHMSSKAPFGVTVWGWGGYSTDFYSGYVSYAYPAGASIQPINEVVVPPTPK